MKRIAFILIGVLAISGIGFSQAPIKRKKQEKTEQTQSSASSQNQQTTTNNKKKTQSSVKVSEPDGYINGHGYVDLGLPSGLKWATCNVGASSPEKFGDYYAWGETTTKAEYNEDNRKTHRCDNIGGNPDYDAATANWKSSWRMPTDTEYEELKKYCSCKLTTYRGIHGCKIIGPNGKSIFLPAAGARFRTELGGTSDDEFWEGNYWATASPTSYIRAYHFHFDILGKVSIWWPDDRDGHSIRPVTE